MYTFRIVLRIIEQQLAINLMYIIYVLWFYVFFYNGEHGIKYHVRILVCCTQRPDFFVFAYFSVLCVFGFSLIIFTSNTQWTFLQKFYSAFFFIFIRKCIFIAHFNENNAMLLYNYGYLTFVGAATKLKLSQFKMRVHYEFALTS